MNAGDRVLEALSIQNIQAQTFNHPPSNSPLATTLRWNKKTETLPNASLKRSYQIMTSLLR